MALPKPQAPQDYLTQLWNIALGRRVDEGDAWLLGPIGEVVECGVPLLAADGRLVISLLPPEEVFAEGVRRLLGSIAETLTPHSDSSGW